MPVFEDHSFIEVPFESLSSGELTWKEYIGSLSPEDLEKQRKYDRNRVKKYYQAHKEEKKSYNKEYGERNRERLTTSHGCDICGGHYQLSYKTKHEQTKKHQDALK